MFVALLMTVFLLAVPPRGYETIAGFTYWLFLLICGGYVLVAMLWHLRRTILERPSLETVGKKLKEIPMAQKCLLGFLLFTLLSGLFSPYPGTFLGPFRREGVLTIGIYILLALCLARDFRPRKWMLVFLGVGLGLVSLLSLIQLTGANPLGLYPAGHNYYGGGGLYYSGVFLGTIGNAGLLAGYVSLAVGLLAMALIRFDWKKRWSLAPFLFLGVLLIFEMDIDAALVALFGGLTLMLPLAVINRKTLGNTLFVLAVIFGAFALSRVLLFQDGPILFAPIPPGPVIVVGLAALLGLLVRKHPVFASIPVKWYRRGGVFAMLAIIVSAALFLWFYSGEPSGLLYEASQVLRGRWDDGFGTRRVYIWRNVLELIRWETFLLGTGPDTLGHWAIPPFTRELEALGITLTSNIDAAHNEYLHILATGGLLSLLAYLGALFFAAVNWIRRPENALSATAGAGVLFYGIQALFGISQFLAAPFYWACLGVLLYTQRSDSPYVR